MRVTVSIVPQTYFVERLGGGLFEVDVMVPPGASPAAYDPSPSQRASLEESEVLLTVGVPWEEAWVPRIVSGSPHLEVVDTAEGIERRPIGRHGIPGSGRDPEGGQGEEHDHEGGEGHGHGGGSPDPHIWLSPELVSVQAENIARALEELSPEDSAVIRDSLASFREEIASLQDSITAILEGGSGDTFVVFHPAWGYFADEFGLRMVPVEVAGSEPSPGEMADLVDLVVELDAGVIFVSPQFSTSSAEAIAAATGSETALLDPLASDWRDNLLRAAVAVAGGSGG